MTIHWFLGFLSLVTLINVVFGYTSNETSDIEALLEFKSKITSDPLQVTKSWNEFIPLRQWHGVTCGSQHKRVTALHLNSSKISGTLSPFVGNMSFLRELVLENNNFIGEIPHEIGRLQRLRFLRLSNNSLTGSIPYNISSCYNLNVIDLSGNHFEGEIPSKLGSLPKLNYISLCRNSLTGQIPFSLGNLSTLENLGLCENELTGKLPNTLGWLSKLAIFKVAQNRLSGSIPPSMFNLSSLTWFSVEVNMIHGNLPSNLFNALSNLQHFSINGNQITGNIPTSIKNASSLEFFYTTHNNLTGKLPSLEKLHKLRRFGVSDNYLGTGGLDNLDFLCSLTNATNLELLGIAYNNLGGILPECISNFTSIRQIFMRSNNISGSIPNGIVNLINIEGLDISKNQLSGEIAYNIGNLKQLVVLYLNSNKLSGKIPSSLGNLQQLLWLSLWNNTFQGKIPYTLGRCKSLNYLYLDSNDLVGNIPMRIFQISSMLEMTLADNRLSGSLPHAVETMKNLIHLDVSENGLSQAIPASLGDLVGLRLLFMRGNFFNGTIPPFLGSLRAIEVIDLSYNNLSGAIPQSLAKLMFLKYLDLSYNNLEGPVPEDGVFRNTTKFAVLGNNKLCGGISKLSLPKCIVEVPHKKASHVVKIAVSVLGGLLVMLALIGLLISHWLKEKRNRVPQDTSEDPFLRLSYETLLKATNGFSPSNLLGSGSFGSVYKAILDKDETTVAVKVLNLQRLGASKSFLAECQVLREIRHRNLVKVLTACSSIDFLGNEFKALVYEFMVNGSLHDWLHPFSTGTNTDKLQKHLGLVQRLNIALDVACALDYLHHHCEIPIIHRDIKPSNVLLNDEMIGHIGDFGLSKILLDAPNKSTTSQTSSTVFNGTIGYIAPEYGMGTSVSTEGDVYSYGVLLLEMFTGKRPNDDFFHESMDINCFVKAALPDKVTKVMDPTLHAEAEELFNIKKPVLECLIAIFETGVSCSAKLPRERKTMGDVVLELQAIKKKLLGNQTHAVK